MQEKNSHKTQIIIQNLLKEERRKRNKSQKDLAKATGFTQSTISKYESGERGLNIIEFMTICKALNINLSSFFIELEKRIRKKPDYET